MSREGIAHLTDLRNLRSFDLSLTSITWGIPASLATFRHLSDPALYGTLLQDKTTGPIVENLPQLRSLNIGAAPITDDGFAVLARHKNIRHLHIQETKITDGGLGSLAALDLRTPNLGRTKVTNAGMRRLGGMKTLETLLHYGTAVTDEGVRELAGLDPLRLLNLHATGGIGKTRLEVVRCMKNLESLSLQLDSNVPEEELHVLIGHPKLRQLHLTQTTLNLARVARLQQEMPECKITCKRKK